MSNLHTLIENRNRQKRWGSDLGSGGQVFFHSHVDTGGGQCQFCWNSPGTGCAILEVWGSAGGGGRMCCCATSGLPGNPPGYSKKIIKVCSSSYICGWAGCATQTNSLCCGGRGNCTVACVFNSGNNGCALSQAGWGGYQFCTTSTAHWYCYYCRCVFCGTCTGNGCGIICNCRGTNSTCGACGASGDINITGAISCFRSWCCRNCSGNGNEETLALPPGLFSADCYTCLRFKRNNHPQAGNQASTGRGELDYVLASMNGLMPLSWRCWQNHLPCGCYEFLGCVYGVPGVPGSSGFPCAGVRSAGGRGGHGAVRITFYT